MSEIQMPSLIAAGGEIPDTRLHPNSRSRKDIFFRGQRLHVTFCANCGIRCGAVNAEAPFAFVLCNSCEAFGAPDAPGLQSIHRKEG